MEDAQIEISKLGAADLHQVSRFRMGAEEDKPLEIFIRKYARKSADANLTQTYIAKYDSDNKVIGYISIMCAEVALEKAYKIDDKDGADKYEYQPAVRIARLATCRGQEGKKIGTKLLETAIGIILLSIVPNAGCRFVILDAKRKSIEFYRKAGFFLLDTPENIKAHAPLMFMDLSKVVV